MEYTVQSGTKPWQKCFLSSLSLFDFNILRVAVWINQLKCCYIAICFPNNGCNENTKNTLSVIIRIVAKRKKIFNKKMTLKNLVDWINTRREKNFATSKMHILRK